MKNRALTLPQLLSTAAAVLILLLLPGASHSANVANLLLNCNGVDIDGDPTSQAPIGGIDISNSIEVLSFGQNVSKAFDSGGRATGRHQYRPIRILKRIDKSTPLLFKALTQNESCEATILFSRPNPAGDGTTEHFFTVFLGNARIVGQLATSPSTLDPASVQLPFLESISFVFEEIKVTYEPNGTEHIDSWSSSL